MNAASLQARFDAAEPFRANKSEAGGAAQITATPFVWRDPRTIPRRPWIFGHWILRNTITAVIAPGGVGKSSLMSSVALALVTGRALLGKTIWRGPMRAWFWNLEDDGDELSRQIQAAAIHYGIKPEDVADRLFVDSAMEGAGLCIATDQGEGDRIIAPVVEGLVAELTARKIDVLIVDPFVSSHAVDENDNNAIDEIAKMWARVAKRAGCAIVLVHHSRKLAGVKVTTEAARGAKALTDAARVTLVLNRMETDEAKRFGIAEDRERRRIFTVQDDKHNRAPAEDAQWFRLASVSLGNVEDENDPFDDDGDNIGVVSRWTPPDAFENVTVDHLRAVQGLIAIGAYKENHQAADWVGKAVAEVLGISADKDAMADRAKINALLRTWFGTGALVVVERRDPEKREMKKYVEVGTPAEDGAPPPSGGAGHGGASGAPRPPRPTSPPVGGGSGAGGAQACKEVGRGSASYVGGNPALGRVKSSTRPGPILAPGETGHEPVPGWEDLE